MALKVNYPKEKTINFKEIKKGEIFLYEGALYIKLLSNGYTIDYGGEESIWNTLGLKDGDFYDFCDDEEVRKINITANIEFI